MGGAMWGGQDRQRAGGEGRQWQRGAVQGGRESSPEGGWCRQQRHEASAGGSHGWRGGRRGGGGGDGPYHGRPAGWSRGCWGLGRVDAELGGNGGLWLWMCECNLQRRFLQPAAERAQNRAKLDALAAALLAEVPGCALASDRGYRALDLAVDFCEDVPPLPEAAVDQIVEAFTRRGATCKVSSIHVNGWFGAFDKLTGVRRLHQDRWGAPLDPTRWAFFGDSANDEPMFAAFPWSVGVANVDRFLPRMASWPSFITKEPGGHGFAEAVDVLLARRAAGPASSARP